MVFTFLTIIVFSTLIIFFYNRLIKSQNLVKEGWGGIDVQLKKRHDLVPNLVAVVKEYANYEEETLVKIINARSTTSELGNIGETAVNESQISNGISKIIALAEKYPDLKADTNFLRLQQDLTEIEQDLQFARRYYNGTVRDFETNRQTFPSNIIANLFDFKEASYFELNDRNIESINPKVNLNS